MTNYKMFLKLLSGLPFPKRYKASANDLLDREKDKTMTNRIGQVFGNYRLTHLLGQGGFADVYLGEHVHLNTWAAIKVLRTQMMSSVMLDFRNEARMIAHLE